MIPTAFLTQTNNTPQGDLKCILGCCWQDGAKSELKALTSKILLQTWENGKTFQAPPKGQTH